MINPVKKITSRLRHWSQVRFEEPVVVFESDDWGMWRSPADKSLIETIGKPKIWAYDQLESPEELKLLYKLLESTKDVLGYSAKIVANFITANPDFSATRSSEYRDIVLKPISQSDASLIEAWRIGLAKAVFIPQYHGRLHFNEATMLLDLQKNEVSKRIFEAGWHGGLNNLAEGGWRLHSEYLHWEKGVDLNLQKAHDWIKKGVEEFNAVFGFRPQSTIAPQYIFSPDMAKVFAEVGFSSVQGANMQQYKSGNNEYNRRLPTGSQLYPGLVALGRNVKFEPSRGKSEWNAKNALLRARQLINDRVPVIFDSHRINYVGQFGEQGRAELGTLLDGLKKMSVRFLTTFELAEAIKGGGDYTDFCSGTRHHITPVMESAIKKSIRNSVR